MSLEKEFIHKVNQHKGILYKVSKLYADSLEDQEDLRQEILIQLWRSYANFKNLSEFSSWMYKVALNTAITYFKSEKKINYTHEHIEVADEAYATEKDQKLEIFYKAVQELNAIDKALLFYYMEGLSSDKIALQMGMSDGNVRVKISRLKDKLQKIVKKYEY